MQHMGTQTGCTETGAAGAAPHCRAKGSRHRNLTMTLITIDQQLVALDVGAVKRYNTLRACRGP